MHGATDAAKNAADLILTEVGLSPIYGAVLESRRIFTRMKSYVVYRVAASIILVLTLSILIFVSGCAVDSLLIIILALLNDVSMIPVAYDNALATSKPQLPNAQKIVIMSLFYGIVHAIGGLAFIFIVDAAPNLENPIALNSSCDSETRGFIWYHLVLVTELMIFSVRAPTFFLQSTPSIYLLMSVMSTCVGATFIAVYGSGLSWRNVPWIIMFNLGMLLLTDVLKIWVRALIGDSPGDVITSDELMEVAPVEKTDSEMRKEKDSRYLVHNQSILPVEDRQHVVRVKQRSMALTFTGLDDFFGDFAVTDGYINKNRLMHTTDMPTIAERASQRNKQHSSPF